MLRSRYRFAGLVVLLALAGCDQNVVTDLDPTGDQADILFVHAAPAGGGINLLIDEKVIASDQSFGETQNAYARVNAGTRPMEVAPTGTTNAVVDRALTLVKGERYTLFAINDTIGMFDLLLFHDDLTKPAEGQARIRLANLIPDAPPAQLAFSGSGTGPIFNDIYFKARSEIFISVDARPRTLRVVNAAHNGGGAGTGGGGKHALVPDLPVEFQSGRIYTIALVGRMADNTARIVLITHPPIAPRHPD